MKRRIKITGVLLVILFISSLGLLLLANRNLEPEKEEKEKEEIIYQDYYTEFANTKKEANLYLNLENEMKKIGTIRKDFYLELSLDDQADKGYFQIKNTSYYVNYDAIEKVEKQILEDDYLNYIPFNESIKTSKTTNFYLNDELVISLDEEMTLPILVKEDNYYGVIFYDRLLYVKKDECEVIENENTTLGYTNGIASLVYHFVYDSTNKEEEKNCKNSNITICLSDTQFKSHLTYIKDNGFYTATMKDISLFVDGKIRLPEKTVLITIDDGYFVQAAIKVLEELDLHATLFLIGTAGSPDNYQSDNLEIHSHTYNLHYGGVCSGGQGSPLKCLAKEKILEDLQKSREQLNGSTVFCYPFFEYNDYAISVLQEAGFEMAFIGGRRKIKVGTNKYLLPRYGIINTTYVSDIAKIIN